MLCVCGIVTKEVISTYVYHLTSLFVNIRCHVAIYMEIVDAYDIWNQVFLEKLL